MAGSPSLEAVLRPPVQQPTALAWIPDREELVVGTRGGEVVCVDPVLGTRDVVSGLGEVAAIDVHPDRKRFLAMCRDGSWLVAGLDGQVCERGEHAYTAAMTGFFADEHLVLVGDERSGAPTAQIFRGSRRVARLRLPQGATAVLSSGGISLVRATAAGLQVLLLDQLRRGDRFPGPSTTHSIRGCNGYVVGVHDRGCAFWALGGGAPQTMRIAAASAAITSDGTFVGIGTQHGDVALARLASQEQRTRPCQVRAFHQPVTAVAFAGRGRWLATAAESLRIWSWEDDLPPGGSAMPVVA